jgi:methyl-accepting chemotaxis protein
LRGKPTALEQIDKALAQLDEGTQQNSALGEQKAATARSAETKASAMTARVG